MSKNRELMELYTKHGAKNYLPLPLVLSRGQGELVWDVDGKEYLDFLACYSALNFGHSHPRLVDKLVSQAKKLAVCSRAFHSEELSLFTKEITEFCGMEKVLPMNSGTEAVETALKLARKWGYQRKKIEKGKIIAMANNFHGRTISIVSFSTEKKYREGFGPYTPGFEVVPYGDVAALEKAIDSSTIAVLLEPIQAEAGVLIPPAGYLRKVRELCHANKVLFMLDEIQTGLGRTGKDFAFQHEDAAPDVLILGKSLGGGLLPLSAVLSSHEVMDVFGPGEHGSTFGGNPLACAVGRESLKVLHEEKLSERSAALGAKVQEKLRAVKSPCVSEVRGRGLLIGIELRESAGGARPYCERLAAKGILCKETHDHVIRIAPPLIINENKLLDGVQRTLAVLDQPA